MVTRGNRVTLTPTLEVDQDAVTREARIMVIICLASIITPGIQTQFEE